MQKNKDPKNTLNQEAENEPGLFNAGSASAGPMLRSARKEKALTIADVSGQLNLSIAVIDAIENDSWEHLPEATYVRGYIRSYARLLGLDPSDVFMSFRYNNSEQNISLDSMPRRIEDRKISFSIPNKLKVVLFLAALIGLVSYFLKGDVLQVIESKFSQVTDVDMLNEVKEVESSAISNATNLATTSLTQEESKPIPEESKPATENTEKQPNEKVASIVPNSSVDEESKELLELEFKSTSWVDIRDKDGKKIVYESFPPGQKTSVKAALPIYVFIGNADAVSMHYQGEVVDLQKYKEEVYAKFTLGE